MHILVFPMSGGGSSTNNEEDLQKLLGYALMFRPLKPLNFIEQVR